MAMAMAIASRFPNQCCLHPDACSCEMASDELTADQIAYCHELADETRKRWAEHARSRVIDLHERAIDDLALSVPPSKKEGEG